MALEIKIPTMPWKQIGGDMSPDKYGGVIATADGSQIELIQIDPVRQHMGDGEAAEVGFPFWTREACFDLDDLDPESDDVRSALQYVGLDVDALADMSPEMRALTIADALLSYGRADEGPAGWSDEIGIPGMVEWYDGKVAGPEYLADENDEFRREILGEGDEEDDA